jgi:hypothetical protein
VPENSERWAVPWYDTETDRWLMHLCDDEAAAEEFAAQCRRNGTLHQSPRPVEDTALDHPWTRPPALVLGVHGGAGSRRANSSQNRASPSR